jgi:hypothetical protein
MDYDSTADTQTHIRQVAEFMCQITNNLEIRAKVHDQSKLQSPEKEAFDVLTPKLKDLTYGSDEYRAALREMKPAIRHHYEANSHHPEHYQEGVLGMSLMDVIEMLADWAAAGQRQQPPNSINSAIAHNAQRFDIPPYVVQILYNTVKELGWK